MIWIGDETPIDAGAPGRDPQSALGTEAMAFVPALLPDVHQSARSQGSQPAVPRRSPPALLRLRRYFPHQTTVVGPQVTPTSPHSITNLKLMT